MGTRDGEASSGRKSLEELEGSRWGPPAHPSHVVTSCHRLRAKPIGDLTVEELRLLIGQGIGLQFLIPPALEVLEREPLAEGDFHPGDLLKNVLTIGAAYWDRNSDQQRRVLSILDDLGPLAEHGDELMAELILELDATARAFRGRHGGVD